MCHYSCFIEKLYWKYSENSRNVPFLQSSRLRGWTCILLKIVPRANVFPRMFQKNVRATISQKISNGLFLYNVDGFLKLSLATIQDFAWIAKLVVYSPTNRKAPDWIPGSDNLAYE